MELDFKQLQKNEETLVSRVRLILYEADSFDADRFSTAWNGLLTFWIEKKYLVMNSNPKYLVMNSNPFKAGVK